MGIMNQHPKNSPHKTSPAEPPRAHAAHGQSVGDDLMADVIFKLQVNQLATTLRTQPMDAEANIMLGMLESLVIAGEIPLSEFMQRVQNLFPEMFAQIDTDLREKLLSMLGD